MENTEKERFELSKRITDLRHGLKQSKSDRQLNARFGKIWFLDGEVYACDSYILYIDKTSNYTDADLDGKTLDFDSLAAIAKIKKPATDGENIYGDNGFPIAKFEVSTDAPPFKSVIPDKDKRQEVEHIGIDTEQLYRLGKCFGTARLKLTFNGVNRAVNVSRADGEGEMYGTIVPVMVNQ